MNEILLIEDELKIARFLQLELTHEGYSLTIATEGRDGLIKAMDDKFDLIILDLMLPNLSGIEICRRLRSNNIQTPIIMLTAKSDVSDKVMGLDIGADDYMTKPFAIEELLARMRVALKHSRKKEDNKSKNILTLKNITVDMDKRLVKVDNDAIELTKKEFELLVYLIQNKNIVISREQILNAVWGYTYMGETNVVDVYVRYLRSKLDEVYDEKYIYTIRGVGYFVKDEED